jgi:hypothetical protein
MSLYLTSLNSCNKRDDKSSWASLTTDVNSAGSWRFSDKIKADKKISKKKSEGNKSTEQMPDLKNSIGNIMENVVDEQINEDEELDAKKREEEEDKQMIKEL